MAAWKWGAGPPRSSEPGLSESGQVLIPLIDRKVPSIHTFSISVFSFSGICTYRSTSFLSEGGNCQWEGFPVVVLSGDEENRNVCHVLRRGHQMHDVMGTWGEWWGRAVEGSGPPT